MSKSKKIVIGIIGTLVVILMIGAGFVLLYNPSGPAGLQNDNSYQSQSDVTLNPDASINPDIDYLKDQILHPVGGGG